MLKVGLTGGIGSGKSTVAQCFADSGVPVIEADAIARELVMPGMPALARIVVAFGADILTGAGVLDRARLRALIFRDAAQRASLEAILHPLIRAEMEARIGKLSGLYCVLCIPLLLETRQVHRIDRVLVVDAPHYLQYRRVMERDHTSTGEVAAILRAQIGFRERLAQADDIINNDQDLSHLRRQVDRLHLYYQKLATQSLPAPPK
ncbi:MAG: dephospho-CoA kinase [Gammaproteobacteria bacterium]